MGGRRRAEQRVHGARWQIGRWLLLLVAVAIVAVLAWRTLSRWAPSRALYPVQGVYVTSDSGVIDWRTIGAMGVDFAYLRATDGAEGRDPGFEAGLAAAREAGVQAGAVVDYDACAPAADQAAIFVTTVPRDRQLLPPVVRLSLARACKHPPARPVVLSELSVLLMQIEAQAGKPALLMVGPRFEQAYAVSDRVLRTLWLTRDFLKPDYAVRPWVMWTANQHRRIEGAEAPVAWAVMHP